MFGRCIDGLALSVALLALAAGCGDDSAGGTAGASSSASTADGSGGSTSPAGTGGESSGKGGDAAGTGGGAGTGGDDPSGGTGGGAPPLDCEEGPTLGQGPTCVACQTENCCINASGCNADESCQAVEACTLENNSVSDCVDENEDAIWYVSGVVICRQNNCAEECGFDQATCGNIIPSPASCTEEVQAACCDETTACGENDACVALIYQCFDARGCTDSACLGECFEDYPDGVDDFETMADCWDTVECLE